MTGVLFFRVNDLSGLIGITNFLILFMSPFFRNSSLKKEMYIGDCDGKEFAFVLCATPFLFFSYSSAFISGISTLVLLTI